MSQSSKLIVSTSKFLSLVLRHQPDVIGVELDGEGWLEIDALINAANRHGKKLSPELLHRVVAENDKKRFAISDDGLRIRASQGHSLRSVELSLTATDPPDELFHGTISASLAGIRKSGLLRGKRNHVHLSPDLETARRVGSRRGKPVILTVVAAEMHAAGHSFFLSANEVWLTDHVPTDFIRFPSANE